FEDRGAVVAEPFRQWVIEDRFAAERPAWEAGGAELVGDVAPYELMKLRLLNAAHSTLAYLGRLLGHDYVHQAIGDRRLRAAVERLWAEAAPTVPVPTADYRRALIERFANPALNHRLLQIAMDGSQKLPQRVLAGLRERLARGEPIDALALTVAGWMRFIVLSDSLDDPLGAELKRRARGTPAEVVSGVLGLAAVFGADLAGAKPLVAATTRWLEALTASPAAALEKGVGHA
ncbi:MAG: mannitol dehydrogenase family protein, partial [Alphaproteobacteria bacterium]|nr:mannitol dehydrogenase family protein [Alphaproteobacteria bacterium]